MAVQNITTGEIKEEEPTQALADQGFVPVDTSSLNSSTLSPEDNIDFNTYQETPAMDISKIDSTLPLEYTQSETQQIGLENEIAQATKDLLGESAFRAEQETAQGLPDLLKTQTDLQSQLKAIQAESQSIPLQLQQESIGRGRTKAGLAPLQSARLRNNAIQALTTNALLEASRGNIATAQDQVDRAVAQKYDPIKERIAVNKANLQLLIDSPRTSVQDKNRAQKQIDIQNAKLREAARQEAEDAEIWNMSVSAAQSGADSVTLNAIRNAKSKEEALQIMTEAGIYAKTEAPRETVKLGENEYLFDSQTGELLAATGASAPSELELREFGLEEAKTMAELDKTQAEIAKIYNDINTKGDIDPLDYQKKLLDIRKLEQEVNANQAKVDQERISKGDEFGVVKDKLDLIEGLMNHSGLNSAVGQNFLGRIPILDYIGDKKGDFVAGINLLVSQETLDTLTALKAKGGTLGALSDQERIMLQNAATKFGNWAVKDDNGNTVGYDTSESNIRNELDRIFEQHNKLLAEAQKEAQAEPIGTEATVGGEFSW